MCSFIMLGLGDETFSLFTEQLPSVAIAAGSRERDERETSPCAAAMLLAATTYYLEYSIAR